MVEKIIAIIADISAGKDTAAKYISEKYKYEHHTVSDILRSIARERKLAPIRKNLSKIADEIRKKEGKDALIIRELKKIKQEKVIFAGIRDIDEIKYLQKNYKKKVIVLYLKADAKVRFERIKARGRTGDPKTFEEFLKMEKAEGKKFKFKQLFKMADYTIENNGTEEEFHKKLDEFMKSV